MIYGTQPPTWLIVAVLFVFCVPASAVLVLIAVWLFDWFYRRREGEAE